MVHTLEGAATLGVVLHHVQRWRAAPTAAAAGLPPLEPTAAATSSALVTLAVAAYTFAAGVSDHRDPQRSWRGAATKLALNGAVGCALRLLFALSGPAGAARGDSSWLVLNLAAYRAVAFPAAAVSRSLRDRVGGRI
eukprot:7266481-Prymnesium_polylepis.1